MQPFHSCRVVTKRKFRHHHITHSCKKIFSCIAKISFNCSMLQQEPYASSRIFVEFSYIPKKKLRPQYNPKKYFLKNHLVINIFKIGTNCAYIITTRIKNKALDSNFRRKKMNLLKNKIKTLAFSSVALFVFGFISFNVHATPIVITPGTAGVISGSTITNPTGPGNCEPNCIYDAFNINGGVNDGSLSLLYKSDVGSAASGIGNDSGTFAASYQTTFANTPTDPADALIEYLSGASITCPDCYLAIKDGNQNPSYYFYDLSSWDGLMDISMQGFWPNRGAISHVSIWGDPRTNVPEPGILLLLGIGLFGFVLVQKQQHNPNAA